MLCCVKKKGIRDQLICCLTVETKSGNMTQLAAKLGQLNYESKKNRNDRKTNVLPKEFDWREFTIVTLTTFTSALTSCYLALTFVGS